MIANKYILIVAMCLISLGSHLLIAGPTIDGKIATGEYTTGHYTCFTLDNASNDIVKGQIWETQANGFLSVGFVMPLALVDNTYGQKTGSIDNSVGWGPKGTELKHLINSDLARFNFCDSNGSVLLDLELDYVEVENNAFVGGNILNGIAPDKVTTSTSMEYNWLNNNNSHPEFFAFSNGANTDGYSPETNWDGNYPVDYSNPESAYSPLVNIDSNPNNDVDWVFEVIYEVRIDMTLLGNEYSYVDVVSGHVSPMKEAIVCDNPFEEPIPIPPSDDPVVPVPSSILLCLGGIATFAGGKKISKKA
ncbi:MAG: hypothetical protein JEZ07_14845 [Phycisphaerae bacterium]|nr:hypothetical protein [Phycisphaerae bacterium]